MLFSQGHFFPCPNPKALVILFHGYGASGENLAPLAQALAFDNVAFWVPDGLSPCESVPGGYQWFSLKNITLGPTAPPVSDYMPFLEKAAEQVHQLIIQGLGDFTGPIIVGGFSQGAALAYYLALNTLPVAGCLGFSGFYHLKAPPKFRPPLFWSHGEQDDVVPMSWARLSFRDFDSQNLSLEHHILPNDEHSISQEAVIKARNFLSHRLP